MDRAQRLAQFLAHLGVQRSERLVEQQDLGFARQRPGKRDSLALAARQLRGIALAEPRQVNQREQIVDALGDLGLGRTVAALHDLEAEGNILGHRHVPEQGIMLEHEADAALGSRDLAHVLVAEPDGAAIGIFKPGDDP